MTYKLRFIYLFLVFKLVLSDPEAYITGGGYTTYNKYPHSVYLGISCQFNFMCGGSILNQDIVLTAAHCMEGCERARRDHVQIKYGHETIPKMKTTYMKKYRQHQHYDDTMLRNDICLISTSKSIPLNNAIKRIILMRRPPVSKFAYIAGWGIDEYEKIQQTLKHTSAGIQKLEVCRSMGFLPSGVFCAGPMSGLGAADRGDSGGALIINNYVQIGLVSFKVEQLSLVAYTNVSYFMDWIKVNAHQLVC